MSLQISSTKICSALCCYLRAACCINPAQSNPVPLAASPGVSVTSRGSRLPSCCVSAHSPRLKARKHCQRQCGGFCPPFPGKELFVQREVKPRKCHVCITLAKSALDFGIEKYSTESIKHSGQKINGQKSGRGGPAEHMQDISSP